MLVRDNNVAESGSVLVNDPKRNKLVLFNEDNCLYTDKLLEHDRGYLDEFNYQGASEPQQGEKSESIAAYALDTNSTQRVNDVTKDGRFVGDQTNPPFWNIVCVPIPVSSSNEPFGVTSFHNNTRENTFGEEQQAVIETYTRALGIALDASNQTLDLDPFVFIVHGRDERALEDLRRTLDDLGVKSEILAERVATTKQLFSLLDDAIVRCAGAFVLMTPDDEGREAGTRGKTKPRARQNVIFEAGILSSRLRRIGRVQFLVQTSVELPSDIKGLLYVEFDHIGECRDNIKAALTDWKIPMKPRKPGPRDSDSS